jgi:type IV pilus assembly protein PilA
MNINMYMKRRQERVIAAQDHQAKAIRAIMRNKKSRRRRGFTLIEILVVIGIIAVLAAIVLVAVNPSRQFKLARDSQRVSNVESILSAVGQNIAEHKGLFTCPAASTTIPSTATDISSNTSGVDLAPCLVPDYISALPFDPSSPGAFYTSTSSYNTDYVIYEDDGGRITASSTGEITPSISATR